MSEKSNHFLRNFMTEMRALDIGYIGNIYTWCNCQGGRTKIRERLDRVLTSPYWRTSFKQAGVIHFLHRNSNHIPIQLNMTLDHLAKPRLFEFQEIWTRNPRCKVVGEAWKKVNRGNLIAPICYKTLHTTIALRKWNKNFFGVCQARVKKLEDHIQRL